MPVGLLGRTVRRFAQRFGTAPLELGETYRASDDFSIRRGPHRTLQPI